MGWRSWNWFACDVNQTIMEQQAAAIAATPSWASKSLLQLGYSHIGLDDCWQSCTGPKGSFHDKTTGDPIVNTTAFPSLAGMVSHAAALGLSSGFYGDNCRCHVGEELSHMGTHYAEDAALTLEAGFAGTKIDSCGNQRNMTAYAELFAAANRTMLVESCGNGPPGTEPKTDLPPQASYLDMLKDTCPWSLYRVSRDLGPTFLSTVYNVNRGLPFLERGPGVAPLSRPGCWMYPDMMMVGVTTPRPSPSLPAIDPNPMTPVEWRTHFAMWAVTSSPLILGFDLTDDARLRAAWPIIANEETLAVSQSWSGHPGFLVANSTAVKDFAVAYGRQGTHFTNASLPSWQAWAKPLKDNGMAVLVVRVWENKADSQFSLPLRKFYAPGSAPASVAVRDIHAHTDNGTASAVLTVDLPALHGRDSVFLVLTPAADGALVATTRSGVLPPPTPLSGILTVLTADSRSSPSTGCDSALNCSLNGVCNTATHTCACYPPWTGPTCGVLAQLPAKAGAGYAQTTGPMAVTSWGGSVLQGRGADNGTWHLLVTEMTGAGCGLHVWQNQSSVVHATASDPQGPYTRQGLAVGHQAHNPQTIFFDGKYYMFHIGSGCSEKRPRDCHETWNGTAWPGAAAGLDPLINAPPIPPLQAPLHAPLQVPLQDVAPRTPVLVRPPPQTPCTGSVIHWADSPAGPWKPLILPPDANYNGCNNPSPYIHPNGTIFLVCTWTIRSALRPEGPWTDPVKLEVGGPNAAGVHRTWEDPFMWTDHRGHFHLLSHTWTAQKYPLNTISAHAFSTDGVEWVSSPIEPYNSTVAFSDGSTHYLATMERPKLVFGGDDGHTPMYITNGVSPVGRPCSGCTHCSHCKVAMDLDWTFTLVRPLDV